MQIQNLNALVDTVRHEIIEQYRPGEDDPHLKVLQAAHISDDEYFSHMVLDDLNLIIRDIREAHKKDSESAPQTTVADELKENLEAVLKSRGSVHWPRVPQFGQTMSFMPFSGILSPCFSA